MNIKKNLAISDSGFVFNPSTGDSYSINPIGVEIIELMKEGKDFAALKAHLLENYLTDEATLEKDLYDFTSMLRNFKLIEDHE